MCFSVCRVAVREGMRVRVRCLDFFSCVVSNALRSPSALRERARAAACGAGAAHTIGVGLWSASGLLLLCYVFCGIVANRWS